MFRMVDGVTNQMDSFVLDGFKKEYSCTLLTRALHMVEGFVMSGDDALSAGYIASDHV